MTLLLVRGHLKSLTLDSMSCFHSLCSCHDHLDVFGVLSLTEHVMHITRGPWVRSPHVDASDLEAVTIFSFQTSQIFEGASLRALYLAKQVAG